MISPLPQYHLPDVVTDLEERPSPFPTLDRAFDAVEGALARLGVEDPGDFEGTPLQNAPSGS